MQKLTVRGQAKNSTILIGERLTNAIDYIDAQRVIAITDDTVDRLYRDQFPSKDIITIGTGETIKNLDTVQDVYRRLIDIQADRATFILGIGGGVVCDICGFVASTYMRGLKFGYIPTTLLAQVDASVGGKNGVNLEGYKNLAGTFNQPEFVLCDGNLLKTLPPREVICGMAEIIKHAAIADIGLFNYLENNCEKALRLDKDVIEKLVCDSVVIKSEIVNRDETEQGGRRKLNFGHTFGHAIEKGTDYNHGEAIGVGMAIAGDMSVARGLLNTEASHRLKQLLQKYQLPITVKTDSAEVFEAIQKDKKRSGDSVYFVFLNQVGRAVVEKIPMSWLQSHAGTWMPALDQNN